MLQAKELMIGDWFQTTFPNGKVEYRKVDDVSSRYVGSKDSVTNAIEPIPLTPEILEKNGFESESNIFGAKTYSLDKQYVVECRENKMCFFRKINSCGSLFWICDYIMFANFNTSSVSVELKQK